MRYILPADLMKAADRHTIHDIGLPSLVLMERAALGLTAVLKAKNVDLLRPLIVCGSGNNGGDGFAIARLLYNEGIYPTVVFVGKESSLSDESRCQASILENLGVSIGHTIPPAEYSVVMDAVLGIGLTREVEGNYADVIRQMNTLSAVKVAVDIPSGIHGTTGEVLGISFAADITVTFGAEKLGTVLFPGRNYAGEVVTVDIGIDLSIAASWPEACYTYEWNDLRKYMPLRKANSHKGSYGKVLAITGSEGMAGAAYLSAKAAYEVGSGLVRIYTVPENLAVLQTLLPEAIITTYTAFDKEQLQELMDWADVVLAGPGLGTGDTVQHIIRELIAASRKPCLIDADGLNILAKTPELYQYLGKQVVVTPHMKEMSRLSQTTVSEWQKDRCRKLNAFVEETGVVGVLKDSCTIAAAPNHPMYINTSGNAAMAKAGAGDVLAGMITGLLAQGMEPFEAAAVGVYLHGLAGDRARAERGSYSVAASDIIASIHKILNEIREVKNDESI